MNTQKLIINPELKDILPPLSKEELHELETNIREHGCLTQLLVWGNTIVDGHNRYEICSRLGIDFEIKKIEFKSVSEAKFWIWQHQKGRRNTNAFIRGEMALIFKDVIVAKAKSRQRGGQGGVLLCQNSDKAKKIDTKKVLAKSAEISHDTLLKIEFILEHADEETKVKLRSTKKETSIHKEYKRLKAEFDATQPKKEKKARSRSKASSEKSNSDSKQTQSTSSEKKQQTTETKTTATQTDPEQSQENRSEQTTSDFAPETITVTLKSSPKVNDRYCCGVKFEPDPDDDFFDWITDAEREELAAMREGCPNRVVPQIHNFTIQNIPEHKPDQLLACLFSLFKIKYREKLAYGLLRKMFNEDDKKLALEIVTTLVTEFQNQ